VTLPTFEGFTPAVPAAATGFAAGPADFAFVASTAALGATGLEAALPGALDAGAGPPLGNGFDPFTAAFAPGFFTLGLELGLELGFFWAFFAATGNAPATTIGGR
jgi:hypothetical protein